MDIAERPTTVIVVGTQFSRRGKKQIIGNQSELFGLRIALCGVG